MMVYSNAHQLNHTMMIVYFALIVSFQFKGLVLGALFFGILSIYSFIVDKNFKKLCGTYESLMRIYFDDGSTTNKSSHQTCKTILVWVNV